MKPFRKQFLECFKNGTLIHVKNYPHVEFPKVILVCLKYKSYCGGDVCLKERKNEK